MRGEGSGVLAMAEGALCWRVKSRWDVDLRGSYVWTTDSLVEVNTWKLKSFLRLSFIFIRATKVMNPMTALFQLWHYFANIFQ